MTKAVEFRDRAWVAPENLDDTVGLLKELKIGLVVADELECELYNSNTVVCSTLCSKCCS